MKNFSISGNVIDIVASKIFKGQIFVQDGLITQIIPTDTVDDVYILPGFIDAHVHIESSMLPPSEFARYAVLHGTVATVSDPHEIANVNGMDGVNFMIDNGNEVPFKFYFGAPSCVPATGFETAGAEISVSDIETLLQNDQIRYLAEMMNWPGVLHKDKEVIRKIAMAQKYGKPIDGHAPGLRGQQAKEYISAGISTDHECFTREEAEEKLSYGMKILIREGSAAKNFEELIPILNNYEDLVMFCSDDKHPDSLMLGHINSLVQRALDRGMDIFKILKAACLNPVKHYRLNVGLLQPGDPADFIVVKNLQFREIFQTYITGHLVAENGKTFLPRVPVEPLNNFTTAPKNEAEFSYASNKHQVPVIEAIDGQLITLKKIYTIKPNHGFIHQDVNHDLLKITVVNRYRNAPPSVAFVKGFGLREGALASSVGHDSHNIIAVGATDRELTAAVNEVIRNKGGLSAVYQSKTYSLALPIAGLMSTEEGNIVAEKYTFLDQMSRQMGSTLSSPFMTLSFMALLVIPSLKLSDLGLFDGDKFEFIEH